jgi:hypothetical protein
MKPILVALMLGVCAAPAYAQQGAFCGPRERIVAQLADKHGETRRAVGLQQNMQVMELYANDGTGSWTIIVAMPTGVACLVAAGEAFQIAPPTVPGDPA